MRLFSQKSYRQAVIRGAAIRSISIQAAKTERNVGPASLLNAHSGGQLDEIGPRHLRDLFLDGLQKLKSDVQAVVGPIAKLRLEADGGGRATRLGPRLVLGSLQDESNIIYGIMKQKMPALQTMRGSQLQLWHAMLKSGGVLTAE